ncbi:MAG: GntR family transcriptional regulator [Mesorhizobium sp.]
MALKANKNVNPMKKSLIDRPQSLAATVAERLKAAILKRELALGEALSEEKIAEAMGVSRTPVREALTILQLQGLINILPRRGSFVFRPDKEDLHALVEYRLRLELLASELALERAPEPLLKSLRKTIETMEKARDDDDTLAYANADTRFHNAFFDHCGNHFFVEAYDIVAGRIAALRAHMSAQLGLHRQRTFQEHLDIVKAVENRDAAALRETLRIHIGEMEPNYTNALQLV